MNTAELLALFDRPIAFHPGFVKLTGSVNAALMLSQALYWTRRTRPGADGWFYKSQEEWTKEIYLTRREQEGARKLLRATGFWLEQRKGNPAKMFYKIDMDAFQMLVMGVSSVQTRMAENAINKPVNESPKAPVSDGVNSHTPRAPLSLDTENTSTLRARAQEIPRRKPEDPMETLVSDMVDYLAGKTGPIAARGTQTKAVQWLLENDYDPVESEACLNYLFTEPWRTTAITWVTVKREIGNWKNRLGSPEKFIPKPNGYSNAAVPDSARCDPERPVWMAGQRKQGAK